MAEARNVSDLLAQTIADQAHQHRVNPHVPTFQMTLVEDGAMLFVPHPKHLAAFVAKKLYRLRNKIFTMTWPVGPWVLMGITLVFVGIVLNSPTDSFFRSGAFALALWQLDEQWVPFSQHFSVNVRVAYLAVMVAVIYLSGCLILQRLFLRILLSYHGWMREKKHSVGLLTKVWGLCIRVLFLGNRKLLLYSFQSALPKIAVPSLEHTTKLYLDSVRPILDDKGYAESVALVEGFMANEASRLQSYVVLKSFITTNYVSTWWERFVYLHSRSPLLINSNYYGLGTVKQRSSSSQVGRAATMVRNLMKVKTMIEHETLKPMLLRGTVPLCMSQYKRAFNTSRIPRPKEDEVLHFENFGKHIVVECGGRYYRLDCYDSLNNLLNAYELQGLLQTIVDMASISPAQSEEYNNIAALTADKRDVWAQNREKYFCDGINHQALQCIERAAFMLHLDPHTHASFSDLGKACLHGTGGNRWCDKSLSVIVFADGQSGMHVEHTFADAPVVAHIWEIIHAWEFKAALGGRHYDKETGLVRRMAPPEDVRWQLPMVQRCPRTIRQPSPLFWVLSADAQAAVRQSLERAQSACSDLHLRIGCHDAFTSTEIKRVFKTSPDACIQLVLQLAQYRDQGKFCLTYESSMTRLFQDGRTETIRSCSAESCAFVRALEGGATPKEELRRLFRAAGDRHIDYTRLAMAGQAVDRHLFALYIVAKGTGVKSEFLERALSGSWNLSTSQLPQFQAQDLWPKECMGDDYRSPSGGFGPVADDGYGVSYMVADDRHIYFHVSSKRHCSTTDSDRFFACILQAFKDVRAVFQDD